MSSFSRAFPAVCAVATGLAIFSTGAHAVGLTKHQTSAPLAFTANEGQWNDRPLFRAEGGGATVWLMKDGICHQFVRRIVGGSNSTPGTHHLDIRRSDDNPAAIEVISIKAAFVGVDPTVVVTGEDLMDYRCHFYMGNDPGDWVTNVPNYRAVRYCQLYDGIDVRLFENNGCLEYEYLLAAGADPDKIVVRYEGADSIRISGMGELMIHLPGGYFTEVIPIAYHIGDGIKIPIDCEYEMLDADCVGFRLPGAHNMGLATVIDPVISYSTYLGGSGFNEEQGRAITVDGDGNAYVTGWTNAMDFPLENPIQGTNGGGIYDAYATKLSASGDQLLFSTYIGGDGADQGFDIAVDEDGKVYVTGATMSTNLPTQAAFQPDNAGGQDAFLTVLDTDGSLVFSTYLGSTSTDAGKGVVVGENKTIYLTGIAHPSGFPIVNPLQPDHGGQLDIFISIFDSLGSSLLFSSFLGGENDDYSQAMALDQVGNIVLTGHTRSPDFPTVNPVQISLAGSDDVFLAVVSNTWDSLLFASYWGGEEWDQGSSVMLDADDNAWVAGYTQSTNFPTVNALQDFHGGGNFEAIVVRFDPVAASVTYSTFLGGDGYEEADGIVPDFLGRACIVGTTGSTVFPLTSPIPGNRPDRNDIFALVLSDAGDSILSGVLLSGSGGSCYCWDGATDASGRVYLTGETSSSSFPILNAYQAALNGTEDAFVTKLDLAAEGCCIVPGDVNNDGSVNIVDLTFLVAHLFNDGPPPECLDQADVNRDLTVNIIDLTYLVAYLFGGGPAPLCGLRGF